MHHSILFGCNLVKCLGLRLDATRYKFRLVVMSSLTDLNPSKISEYMLGCDAYMVVQCSHHLKSPQPSQISPSS